VFVLAALFVAALPANARAEPRVGLGGNVGVGGAVAFAPGLAPEVMVGYTFPSPEIQIFPNKVFSVDLQWDVWHMILAGISTGPNFSMQTYFHFHIPITKLIRFGVAPGMKFGGAYLVQFGVPFGILGYVMRVGPEFLVPNRHFALGIYLRPQITAAIVPSLSPVTIFQMLAELTWTFYPRAL
jgi:hypothetical protein